MIPMLDQFVPFIQGFIEDVVDVKADGNYGYQSVAALLDMGEESWAVMRNELIKELGKWSQDYINLFGGTENSWGCPYMWMGYPRYVVYAFFYK